MAPPAFEYAGIKTPNYVLHLIPHSAGKIFSKVFAGEYIGGFYSENLILTGPHNRISLTDNSETLDEPDKVVTFADERIQSARAVLPEKTHLDALLKHSRFGIEFQGLALIKEALGPVQDIALTQNLKRLAVCLSLMSLLAKIRLYALLSNGHELRIKDEKHQQRVNLAVNYSVQHCNRALSLEEVVEHLRMQPTCFHSSFAKQPGGDLSSSSTVRTSPGPAICWPKATCPSLISALM